MNNNVSFKGKFSLDMNQVKVMSMWKKVKFVQEKEKICDQFCKEGSEIKQEGKNLIFEIEESKENIFTKLLSKFGLNTKKISD